jgi:hypothetical protein
VLAVGEEERAVQRKLLGPVLAIACFAGAVAAGGCGPAATQAPAAGTAATHASAAGRTVHLAGYSGNDGPRSKVILTGAIGDAGEAVSVHPDGTIDPQHNADLKLALTRGSFRMSIAGLDKKIVSAFSRVRFNTTTCSGNVTVTEAAPIVKGSGTGAYRGISGTFTITITIDEIAAKSACNATGAFVAQAIIMTGPGTVSLH